MSSLTFSIRHSAALAAGVLTLLLLCTPASAFWVTTTTRRQDARHAAAPTATTGTTTRLAGQSQAEQERLLMGEVGLTAFIVAEMRHHLNTTMVEFDEGLRYGTRWEMPDKDKVALGLVHQVPRNNNQTDSSTATNDDDDDDGEMVIPNDEYAHAVALFQNTPNAAIDWLCNTTETAFLEGYRSQGLLSALRSAIIFFRGFFRDSVQAVAACERVGLSDYDVAHYITDMFHHRTFRGAYTKTRMPSGVGEVAARRAVGLHVDDEDNVVDKAGQDEDGRDPDDECLLWSPTTPGLCLHWKSDDEAWRTKRFERIQMEGTRDPRRGGSGTTR